MKRIVAILLLLLVSVSARPSIAQVTQPTINRAFPPSMQAELAKMRGSKSKAVIYRDTIKGSVRQSLLSRDTSHRSDSLLMLTRDSAEAQVDTIVGGAEKAHLDSMLAELPEYTGGDHPHFEYPLSIMTEPYRIAVPFDSSVLSSMNPISRESLPYFDEHPLPLPLRESRASEGFAEFGAGTPSLPMLSAGYSHTFHRNWGLNLTGDYLRNFGDIPLRAHWQLSGSFAGSLSDDPAPDRNDLLSFHASTSGKIIRLFADTSSSISTLEHTLALHSLSAQFAGSLSSKTTYDLAAGAHFFNDDLKALSEADAWIRLAGQTQFAHSDFGVIGSIDYNSAGSGVTQSALKQQFSNIAPSAATLSARISDAGASGITWTGGVSLLSGNDISGSHGIRLLPSATVRLFLNPQWELGGSFLPRAELIDYAILSAINPFYSATTASIDLEKDSNASTSIPWQQSAFDSRRAAMDKIALRGYTSYTLSADDEVHADVELVDRDNDVIFYEHKLDSTHSSFYTLSSETRRLTISAGGNLLFFLKDVATFNLRYSSMTAIGTDNGVPFEPLLKMHLAYRFQNLSESFFPSVEFDILARKDRSISSINFVAEYELGSRSAILLRVDNVLGSPSDYWTGYEELPRSVWAALRFRF